MFHYYQQQSRLAFIASGLLLSLLALAPQAWAQSCLSNELGGVVFRDFDADGIKDSGEPGVSGLTVTAINQAGTSVSTTTTDSSGAYVLSGMSAGVSVRVELTGLPNYLRAGPHGTSSATTVSFNTADGSCDIDVALSSPAQYCQLNPYIATPRYVDGDPLGAGTAGLSSAVVAFDYNSLGRPLLAEDDAPISLALGQEVGPTWGLAYQRTQKILYAAALMKRHVGFGSLGTGGIYKIDVSDISSPVVSNYVDLNTLGVDFGVDPRTTTGDPGLSANLGTPSLDPNAYPVIGQRAFGDLEISADERYLYFTNLNSRTLNRLTIGAVGTTPTSSDLSTYTITNPGCSNDEFIPWAVKEHDGEVYVGVSCTAQTSQDNADLHVYILKLSGSTFVTAFDTTIAYTKGFGLHPALSPLPDSGTLWRYHVTAFTQLTSVNTGVEFIVAPQPIVGNIEFDVDGSMILGLMDRSGHQLGRGNYPPNSSSLVVNPPSAGDLLRACPVGTGVWALESNGSCGGVTTSGAGNSQGPGGGEFYFRDNIEFSGFPGIDAHQELSLSGMALKPGSGELVLNIYDPFVFETGGPVWMNNTTGDRVRAYEVYAPTESGTFGKAAGLGDLELLCDPAPVEIGNRVWFDSDADGVQDPGELPVVGVTVTLCDGSTGATIATTTTDSNGNYYFGSASVPGLSYNSSYCLKLATAADYATGGALAGYGLSPVNTGSAINDSDGALTSGYPQVDITLGGPGENDHTFDFGFAVPSCTTTNLATAQATIDGAAFVLSKLVTAAVNLRRAEAVTAYRCNALPSSKASQLTSRSSDSYLSTWAASWTSFDSTDYACDLDMPSATCVSTSLSSVKATLQGQTSRLYSTVREAVDYKCRRRTKAAKKILARAASVRATLLEAIDSLPSSVTSCSL